MLWELIAPPWRACLEEAWEAYRAGSIPIGAAVVDAAGAVVARGRNRTREARGPSGLVFGGRLAHAEVNALLALREGAVDPRSATLYATTEPCPLCMGAVAMANVRTYLRAKGITGEVRESRRSRSW